MQFVTDNLTPSDKDFFFFFYNVANSLMGIFNQISFCFIISQYQRLDKNEKRNKGMGEKLFIFWTFFDVFISFWLRWSSGRIRVLFKVELKLYWFLDKLNEDLTWFDKIICGQTVWLKLCVTVLHWIVCVLEWKKCCSQ